MRQSSKGRSGVISDATVRATLSGMPWFADLSPADVTQLRAGSNERWYPKDSIVFYEGDPGDHLVVVVRGRLQVLLIEPDGSETVISELGPGEQVGELSLIDGLPRSLTARAVERTYLIRIERRAFLALVERRPALALRVLTRVASDLRRATEHIRTLTLADLPGQVVRCHVQIARERGLAVTGAIEMCPQPSRPDIARRIGCRPESVSRAMKELYDSGYARRLKGGVVIEPRAVKRYWPLTTTGPAPLG